jgi:uncharacterized protein YabN with tetrapyrrole methylase and pyrophosphatase domain
MAAVLFLDVLEDTTNLIRRPGATEGVEVKVLPGVSFLYQLLAEIALDFSLGLQGCAAVDASAGWTFQRAIGFDALPH